MMGAACAEHKWDRAWRTQDGAMGAKKFCAQKNAGPKKMPGQRGPAQFADRGRPAITFQRGNNRRRVANLYAATHAADALDMAIRHGRGTL
jgi:hypothetical protein